MTAPRPARRGGIDPQTEQLVASWLRDGIPPSAPPSLVSGMRLRVAATERRPAWRIRDRWLWRSNQQSATGFVFATASAVLALVLVGIGSFGVYMMIAPGSGGPLGAGAEAPATTSPAPMTTAIPPATATAPEEDAVTEVDGSEPSVPDSMTAAAGVFAPLLGQPAGPVSSPEPVAGVNAFDLRGFEGVASVDVADEPSLSGEWRWTGDERRYGDIDGSDGTVATGSLRIENAEGGSWAGPFRGITLPDQPRTILQAELSGSGPLQGTSAMLRYEVGGGGTDAPTIASIVYAGEPPQRPRRGVFDEIDEFVEVCVPPSPAAAGRPADDRATTVTGTLSPEPWDRLSDGDASTDGRFDANIRWYGFLSIELSVPQLQEDAEFISSGLRSSTLEPGAVEIVAVRACTPEDGAWSGSMRGFEPTDAEPIIDAYHLLELRGEGTYTGRSAIIFSAPGNVSEDQISWSAEGLLIPGELPEYQAGA